MKVGIFYNSVSNLVKFSNKAMLMDNFAAGVRITGDTVTEFRTPVLPSLDDLDAGFVLGYTLENNFRKQIITALQAQSIPTVFVDSNILHYARPEHEWHRYSLNSVYPNTGTYFFDGIDTTKWSRYSTWHSASLKPWRSNGNHILIFCQRPNGWNMFGNDQEQWVDATISQIRRYSDRPVMVRMHPGDGKRYQAIQRLQAKYGKTISISTHNNIQQALQNCWCAVGYNSTPNVVAAIEGVPVYVEDPALSWAADVAFTDLNLIETPPMPDRTAWVDRIANIHWSNQEVQTGQLWRAVKQYISSVR
jgi:hypothetical protein